MVTKMFIFQSVEIQLIGACRHGISDSLWLHPWIPRKYADTNYSMNSLRIEQREKLVQWLSSHSDHSCAPSADKMQRLNTCILSVVVGSSQREFEFSATDLPCTQIAPVHKGSYSCNSIWLRIMQFPKNLQLNNCLRRLFILSWDSFVSVLHMRSGC